MVIEPKREEKEEMFEATRIQKAMEKKVCRRKQRSHRFFGTLKVSILKEQEEMEFAGETETMRAGSRRKKGGGFFFLL